MILVTGGCGFIGGHVAQYLAGRGRRVLVLDRDAGSCRRISDRGIAEFAEFVEFVEGDLVDRGFVRDVFRKHRPEVVIHTAWKGVRSDRRNDPEQVHNVIMTNHLLESCAEGGVRLFVGLGSQAEYGVHNVRIDEATLPRPQTLYGLYKLAAGLMGMQYAERNGFRYAWLRLFSAYGPKDNGNCIIPFAIRSFLRDEAPSFTRCEQRWDYLYVKDIPPLLEKVIDREGHFCGIYNLSSGSTSLMRDAILTIRRLTGASAEPRFGQKPYRKEGLMHLEGDNGKFIETFGWIEPTPIEEGLKETVEWFRRTPPGKRGPAGPP